MTVRREIAEPRGESGARRLEDLRRTRAVRRRPEGEPAEEESFGVPEAEITTLVDVSAWSSAKRAAMECHRTQRQDFGWLLELPDDLASRILSPESFVLTRWPYQGVAPDLHETSLFEGLEEG